MPSQPYTKPSGPAAPTRCHLCRQGFGDMQSMEAQRKVMELVRSTVTTSGTQSTRRSREAVFSLAEAKRDLAAGSQLCNVLLKACRLLRAVPKPVHLLSCFSGLTSRTRWICSATQRSSSGC